MADPTPTAAAVQLRPDQLVQKTLAECIEWIENAIPHADRRYMESMKKHELVLCHYGLGMHIRNHCNLWTAGCDEVNKDIKRILDAGITIQSYDRMKLNWETDLKSDPTLGGSSIYHPDNCSAVIIDLYHDLIRGDIGLALIERKP